MLNPVRVKALIIKELQAVWADKRSRMSLILPPMLQLLIFAYAATLEVHNVTIGVLNRDAGLESRLLLHRFEAAPTFTRIIPVRSDEEIQEVMDTQEALMVLHIGQDFSRNIATGKPAPLQVILDGRRANAAQIVAGYTAQIVNGFNESLMKQNPNRPQARSQLKSRFWYNPNLEYIWFTVPSLVGILTLTVTLVVTALSVARERELGTFDQLLVSPLQPLEILIGKAVPAMIIGVAEGTFMMSCAVFLFHIPFTGSLPLVYCAMVTFMLAVTGVGLFISSLSQTQQQAVLGSFLFSSPAILLSGYATPIENMPDWLQPLTVFNPLRYFLVILRGVFLKNMTADIVLANTWPMALIALGTLSGAVWFFRRRLE